MYKNKRTVEHKHINYIKKRLIRDKHREDVMFYAP